MRLKKTRSKLRGKLHDIFIGKVDSEKKEALEELFFEADLGSSLAIELTETIEPPFEKRSRRRKNL